MAIGEANGGGSPLGGEGDGGAPQQGLGGGAGQDGAGAAAGPAGDGPDGAAEAAQSAGATGGAQGWRLRAKEAEARLRELEEELAAARSALDGAREALASMELRHAIDTALASSGAVDLETARLLVERAMASDESGRATVASLVDSLRRDKPFLFRRWASEGEGPALGASAPMEAPTAPGRGAMSLATEARQTGDRGALLRYLRARRAGA